MSILNSIKVVMLKGEKGDKGDIGHGVPTGGTTGQALKKASNTDYDYQWQNTDLPTGGTTGQILKKTSNANYEYDWSDDNSLQKNNIAITQLSVGNGLGTINVSAGSDETLSFDISGVVSSASQVLGIQQYRLARFDAVYTEADGLTITNTEIAQGTDGLEYRMRVYNATSSDILMSKGETTIHLVTFS